MSTRTLNDVVKAAYQTARDHGWWDVPRALRMADLPEKAIPEKIALIHSEASEALEEYRKIGEVPGLAEIRIEDGKPEGFAIELADIVIRVADLCGALSIDLDSAVAKKMAYNKTRPYRHGGKVC